MDWVTKIPFLVIPVYSVLIVTLAILVGINQFKIKHIFLKSILPTILFAGLSVIFFEIIFKFILVLNLVTPIPVMIFFAYILNHTIPGTSGEDLWVRSFTMGLISVIVNIIMIPVLLYLSLALGT